MNNIQLINKNCFEGLKDISKNSVDLIFCDLPYNCSAVSWDQDVLDLKKLAKELWRVAKKETPIIFTAKFKFAVTLFNAFGHRNFRFDMVFTKNRASNFLNCKKMPKFCHENILVFYKKCPKIYQKNILKYHKFNGTNKHYKKGERVNNLLGFKYTRSGGVYEPRLPSTIQKHSIGNCGNINPTQKPESLIEFFIKYYSDENYVVLDPTFGSCTTGAVCKKLKRKFIGFEMDTAQYNKAVERLNNIQPIIIDSDSQSSVDSESS